MKSMLNEFGGHLMSFVSIYMIYYFVRVLMQKGLKWVLAKYLMAGVLIFGAIAVQRQWAGLTRSFAPEGLEFNLWMDDVRGYVNFLVAIPFIIGSYMYESETREIKSAHKMLIIYFSIIGFAGFVTWL